MRTKRTRQLTQEERDRIKNEVKANRGVVEDILRCMMIQRFQATGQFRKADSLTGPPMGR